MNKSETITNSAPEQWGVVLEKDVKDWEGRGYKVISAIAPIRTVPNCYKYTNKKRTDTFFWNTKNSKIERISVPLQTRSFGVTIPARIFIEGVDVSSLDGWRCYQINEKENYSIFLKR